ncbi:class I SAM-dependent methyltransferase [Actinomycetospora termitidis]|uniref:Class I SAM-dependent methyltransferase n=1 Tax=Actinomycetospora termitidis TaxID=3053470 RepID=A0ABT7M6D9_9PSEU|nr:class I SAM-dependent methyltransferase [Actinomycetospora sp. Odt1-22]MDL5156240.1 class I SAM-dependent methyltransferase [Actinomycetospora sp. Odt1-22]
MPLRRLLLLPHLAWWGVRAPRGGRDRWDLYWAGVGSTGDGGDVLWDSGDPAEPDRYLELLERFADPALPVIDLGCGNGRFTRALCRAGWRGIGVDVSDAAIALAREEADRVPEEPGFLVADLAAPDAVDRIRADPGPANVFVRGVLHVLTAEARGRAAANIGRLLGDRGVAVIAETNHRGSLLSYVENLGAGPRGLPHPLARAIASGLPTPRPFGGDELDRTFPADEWERVHVDDTAVIHAVPMHRRSEEPERIRGLVAVVRPRPRIPEPRRGGEETGRVEVAPNGS